MNWFGIQCMGMEVHLFLGINVLNVGASKKKVQSKLEHLGESSRSLSMLVFHLFFFLLLFVLIAFKFKWLWTRRRGAWDIVVNGFREEEMKKEKKALFTIYQGVDDATLEWIALAKSWLVGVGSFPKKERK